MAHRLAPEVEAELLDAWYYVFSQSGSIQHADRLIDSITHTFLLLARHPWMGRQRDDDLRHGLRSFPVGEYIIIYRIEDKRDVLILHVVHGRCDIGTFWLLTPDPSLDDSSVRDADVDLRSLGSIRLSGKMIPTPLPGPAGLRIEATYLAYWGHEFFAIANGMVSSFNVASASVSEDGSFSLMVAEFAHATTVSKLRLLNVIGPISEADMRKVEQAIKVQLALAP